MNFKIFEVLIDKNNKVIQFSEKKRFNNESYINTGIYMMKKSVLKHIPKNQSFNATDLMNAVINEKGKLIHFPITGYWLDIGKHKDLEKAQRDISHIDFD